MPADKRAAFLVFRRSIMDYVHRRGIVESPFFTEAALEESYSVRAGWIEHLWRTAAENWLALDADDRPIGWAMSVERGGLLELSHFFVDPDTQSKGTGRALLERAFPVGRGRHRAIVATEDPRALSLYLRFGVRYVTTVADFEGPPRPGSAGRHHPRPAHQRLMRRSPPRIFYRSIRSARSTSHSARS